MEMTDSQQIALVCVYVKKNRNLDTFLVLSTSCHLIQKNDIVSTDSKKGLA